MLFRYMAITSQEVCPEPVPDRIENLLRMGVPAVQVRDKQMTDRIRHRWISTVEPESRRRLFVNGRADIARLTGCGGVHLPGEGLSVSEVREIAGETVQVGRSTHSRNEVLHAPESGAEYVTFGPIYPTPSKPDRSAEEIPGLETLRDVCQDVALPVIALGGVDRPERVEQCLEAGAHGVAGIRMLMAPEDPEPAWVRVKDVISRFANRKDIR